MNEVLGRLVVALVLASPALWLIVWLAACALAWRMLALRVVAAVAMERDWESVQEWEVRAMAAVLHKMLPWWLQISELRLADASMDEWTRVTGWYRKHNPRGTSLFPEQSP